MPATVRGPVDASVVFDAPEAVSAAILTAADEVPRLRFEGVVLAGVVTALVGRVTAVVGAEALALGNEDESF